MRFFRNRSYTIAAAAFAILTACIVADLQAGAAQPRIMVLVSHQAAPFEGALAGFKEYLASRGIRAVLDVVQMDGREKDPAPGLAAAQKDHVDLIFTLGSHATEAAISHSGSIPVIAGLVLAAEDIKDYNVHSVVLDFPLELQFEWISRILPECRSVGVLYGPRNQRKIEKAAGVAQKKGISLYSRRVDVPSDLPDALNSMAKRVDVLWGIPDELVYNPQTAREILLFSFRNRLPVVGLSSEWVKAGALFSLDWDFQDIGMQCGEMAKRILDGERGNVPRAEYPRRVKYSINLKTASQMKMEIPEKLIKESDQLFK